MTEDGRSPFAPAEPEPLLSRAVPVSAELPRYRPSTARGDAVAALTVAALALPSAMAYAEVAGLSPVNGLARGGAARRHAGAARRRCFVVAWLARLGWIADYFSRPVLVGYIHGRRADRGSSARCSGSTSTRGPIPQVAEVAGDLGTTAPRRSRSASRSPCCSRSVPPPALPGSLVVVVAGIALSSALALADHGVAVVGEIPAGLPSLELPRTPLDDVFQLLPAAVGLFLVTFADGILTARSYAGRTAST